jgi:hypothetical protein
VSTQVAGLVYGVLLPAVVAGVVLLAGRRAWAAALGLGAGYVAGHAVLFGWPALPPPDSSNWPLWFAIGAAALAVVETSWEPRAAIRWLVRALAATGALVIVKPPAESIVWSLEHAAGLLVLWVLLDVLARKLGSASFALVALVLAAGAAAVVGLTGSAKLGQMGGCLAAGLGACWVLAAVGVAREISGGVVSVVAVVLGSIVACGTGYSETPPWMAAAVAATPLAALAIEATPLRRATPWKAATARAILVALPLAGCVVWAYRDSIAKGGFY